MKRVMVVLSLITGLAVFGAGELFSFMPTSIGTAVIAEKAKDGRVGGGAAVLLPSNMTTDQGQMLNKAYEIAKADGHKNPELVQSVLLQETLAGGLKSYRVANPGPEAYFGPMQIKLAAAKSVLSKWPGLFTKYALHTKTDDEIKANLILNDRFNIEVGSKYLLILEKEYGYQGRELVNAYNRGPGGVKNVSNDFHYAKGAEMKLAAYKSGKKI
jgi:hypothetical protein